MKIRTLPRVMVSTREIWRFSKGPKAQSYIHFRHVRKQHLASCEKHVQYCKVGTGDWLAQTLELSKDFIYIGELKDSPDSSVYVPSIIESGEDDSDYGALVDRADQRDQVSETSSSITTQAWAHGPEQSWQGHWQCYEWEHSQDLWDPSEYHNWRWLP